MQITFNVWDTFPYVTFSKTIFFHCLNNHNEKEDKQVESFPNVWTSHLEQIRFVEFLENTPFQFHKLWKKKGYVEIDIVVVILLKLNGRAP